MIGQRTVGPEHGCGFGARGDAVVEEVVRARKSFVEEGQALFLAPRGKIGLGRSGGNEDLFYRAIVERAVLPDIQCGEVKAENFHDPQKRIDVRLDQTTRADGEQTFAEHAQIALQFGRMTVGARTVIQDQTARGCAFRDGQSRDHEIDEFPPRLASDFVSRFAQNFDENGRRLLQKNGQAHCCAQLLQLPAQHDETVQAIVIEAVRGDFRRDQWMSVSVTADPSAEAQPRQNAGMVDKLRIEADIYPCFAQSAIDAAQGFGKHIDQMVQNAGAFHFHRRLVEEHFTGAPQTLERGFDFLAQFVTLGGRPHGVLQLHEQEIELTVLVENGATLGFGGMRGEDGFDAQPWQPRGDVFRGVTGFEKLFELLSPQTRFGRETIGCLAGAAHLRRCVFLDHVEQMEGDRVSVGQTRGKIFALRTGRIGADPRQAVGDVLLSQANQHFAEALHEEVQIGFDFGETDGQTFFVRECFHDTDGRD